jgi:large subunit ribosomal protein L22
VNSEKEQKLDAERETPETEAAAEPGRRRRPRRRAKSGEDKATEAGAAVAEKGADAVAEAAEEAQQDEPESAAGKAEGDDSGDAEEAAAGKNGEKEGAGDEPAEADTPAPAAKRRRAGRRGAAETSTAPLKTPAPRRSPDGTVVVKAKARYVRCAPRKARLVIDHIRGKRVDEARAILTATQRAASRDILKLLDSAVANAEHNHELVASELLVDQAYVDEGPTLKRYRPRALGRATRIRKRTSHMTILLRPEVSEDVAGNG